MACNLSTIQNANLPLQQFNPAQNINITSLQIQTSGLLTINGVVSTPYVSGVYVPPPVAFNQAVIPLAPSLLATTMAQVDLILLLQLPGLAPYASEINSLMKVYPPILMLCGNFTQNQIVGNYVVQILQSIPVINEFVIWFLQQPTAFITNVVNTCSDLFPYIPDLATLLGQFPSLIKLLSKIPVTVNLANFFTLCLQVVENPEIQAFIIYFCQLPLGTQEFLIELITLTNFAIPSF